MASTNSMFKVDRMLEPDEQADLIALAGVSLENDGHQTEHYNSRKEFRKNTSHKTRQRLISYDNNVEEIERFVIEDNVKLGNERHNYSGEVCAYAVDHPENLIALDVIYAKWDNPGDAPYRVYVPNVLKTDAENSLERARRKL